MFKYINASPACLRMQWEIDVFLTNLRSFDTETPVVLLFLEENSSVIDHFRGRYPNLEIHSYRDTREKRNYIPSIGPFLMWNYLKEDKNRELCNYLQVDSDIIFRELPDFDKMPLNGKVCWGADCDSYIGAGYLATRTKAKEIVSKFSEIMNMSVDTILDTYGIGAQYFIYRPTAQLWWHTWQDSQLIYDFLEPLQSDIQKWTASMFSELYNLVKLGWEVKVSPELDFCRPTDNVLQYEKVKILHNAGVLTTDESKMFFKGRYTDKTPFLEDFSKLDPTKASIKYVEAIKKVA